MLFPGATLNGRYVLEELLATGGMGEVWRGTDPSLERRVAVKMLLPLLESDAEFIARFRTEARMMAALRHPGIVQVYDYGQDAMPDGGTLDYLVMEFIEGTPLSTALRQSGTLDPRRVMEIVAEAAEALQVAHEAGIVHRDVKPSNLLIRPGGAVVLVDFGVARSTTAPGITSTNLVMGTAHYMAPEQAEGKPVSAVTDVYALGAVAYCCLAGRTPYVGDGPLEVLGQLVHGPSPTLPPDVPAAVADVVLRAMDKDPARRYQSAAALAEAARAALDGQAAPVVRPPAAPAALLGPLAKGPATTGHTPEPPGTPSTGHDAADENASPARTGRRLIRTFTVLAIGALVGATGATVDILVGLADDAREEAQPAPSATPDRGQPGPAPASGLPRKQSVPPQTSKPGDVLVGPVPSGPADSDNPATNPHRPETLCGAGYGTVDSTPLRSGDTLLGAVYLLADGTGNICVVTLKTSNLGEKTPASAYLQLEDADRDIEAGDYEFYAGPVRDRTGAGCIRWGGSVDSVSFDSPLEHCQ